MKQLSEREAYAALYGYARMAIVPHYTKGCCIKVESKLKEIANETNRES